jgi:addiction module RelB/DinJ family antitoxin
MKPALTSNANYVTIMPKGVDSVEKSTTLNLRVNPMIKQQAEDVLKQLGVPMATAVDMFLRQITLTGGIPFDVSLPKVPVAINADAMAAEQLRAELMAGYEDMKQGNTQDASTAFAKFRETHR